jgi:tetratricopeptide (TPR) repeat protein
MNGKTDRPKSADAAERLVRSGRLSEAVAEYEKLLEGTALDIPIRSIIGDLCVQLGREDQAVKIFRANVAALERQGAISQALAVCKRIHKLSPSDVETQVKLGDLYSLLGFSGEAKVQYGKALLSFDAENDVRGQTALYEKLIKLDRSDVDSRLKLAGLMVKTGQSDRASAELNDTADLLLVRGEEAEAGRVLQEALKLNDGDFRTLANLARVLKRAKRTESAITMVEESVQRHGNLPELSTLLGDLYLENLQNAEAREVFERFLKEDPDRADARAKLSVLELRGGQPDKAYVLIEPLVVALISKSKDDKAIGLLGLIILAYPSHIPSLEKIAFLFRRGGRVRHLETVLRALRNEARRPGFEDLRRRTLRELAEMSPGDKDVQAEWRTVRGESGTEPEAALPRMNVLPQKDQDIIQTNLTKADLYIEQGLLRNARRIMENLRALYPEDSRIVEKLERIAVEPAPASPEALSTIVERLAAEDSRNKPLRSIPEAMESDTVSLEEIFDGSDLTATSPGRAPTHVYPDLSARIREELDAIEAAFYKQVKSSTSVIEKGLVEIVGEFKRQIEEQIERTNHEAHYNLGVAFLEQGLLDEAVAEFELAAQDPARTADCYGLIGQAFRRKKNFREALRWTDEALRVADQGSDADYALTYERADLLEDLNDNTAALGQFRRVRAWNSKYRDVAKRVKILEKIT